MLGRYQGTLTAAHSYLSIIKMVSTQVSKLNIGSMAVLGFNIAQTAPSENLTYIG